MNTRGSVGLKWHSKHFIVSQVPHRLLHHLSVSTFFPSPPRDDTIPYYSPIDHSSKPSHPPTTPSMFAFLSASYENKHINIYTAEENAIY